MAFPLLHGPPPELVVHDRLSPCPYLPGQVARLPLRLPTRDLSREELDLRLAEGDRRQGVVLYRTHCPRCRACEPLRLHVPSYRLTRAQRRIWERGRRELRLTLGVPTVDDRRVELYNRHKEGRGLDDQQPPIDEDGYREFLVNSCCESFELAYYLGAELVAVAITDRGAHSLSAVYCMHDPAHARLGLGTFSILTQLDLCRTWGLPYLYLGLYVRGSAPMQYKARFVPHQRLVKGRWVEVLEVPEEARVRSGARRTVNADGGDPTARS